MEWEKILEARQVGIAARFSFKAIVEFYALVECVVFIRAIEGIGVSCLASASPLIIVGGGTAVIPATATSSWSDSLA